jgi:hypothetical protein
MLMPKTRSLNATISPCMIALLAQPVNNATEHNATRHDISFSLRIKSVVLFGLANGVAEKEADRADG